MAVSKRTLRLLAGMRIQIGKTVDAATEEVARAWGAAWNEVAPEWQAAIDELIRMGNDGKWPTRMQVLRAERAARALEVTKAALDDLATNSGVTVTRTLPDVVALTETIHRQLIASQYPAQAGSQATLTASFARVDSKAAAAIVKRSTQRITALHRPLSAEATQAMKSSLIRGVLIGENPNRAASRMIARVKGDFDGGLVRAKVIARSEILDAHRAAGMASDLANKDVLQGWTWMASLDARTCVSCLAKHGEEFPLDQAGPEDHQQGRCARLSKTKSWRDLGFDLDEPDDLTPSARDWFAGLPKEDQVAVMGKARLDLLGSGKVGWDDLTTKRSTSGWRDSWAPTSVADLTKKAAAR